jgi:NitT/TauT family transport system ATP-binding protein
MTAALADAPTAEAAATHRRRAPDAADPRGRIECRNVDITLGFGDAAFAAVRDLSFTVAPREFVCILGPSGCGKSTLLGALAGHLPISRGRLSVDGTTVRGPSRERGIVFQHHTLFQWRRVVDNVAFGLKMAGVGRVERRQAARDYLRLVGLDGHADKYPSQLSGGMQQRVEIARALINRPRILLMDEPFGALDALTRISMQELLLEAWNRHPTTVLFVTHDIDEALFLSDRVIVMTPNPGRVLDDIRVPFGPRRSRDVIVTPEFVALKSRCVELLRPRKASTEHDRLSPLGT